MNHRPSFFVSQRGAALVLTLMALVLLAIFAVAFLASVAGNRATADSSAGQVFTQALSDSVVDLVKSQIAVGTQTTDGGTDVLWASQPGAIRTFGANGAGRQTFKLYSAADMTPASFSAAADVPSAAQAANLATWTDLNQPVLVPDNPPVAGSTGVLRYPILPPPDSLDSVGGVPVDNPATATQEGIQGFSINATSTPGYTSGNASATNNPASMFVRWIYVLADGSMVAAQEASNTPPGTATVTGATPQNPIVGRVAFWTDDETSKVNINTASEGTFWDVPRANTAGERLFSSLQPVINEFQRLPGHPAMTSLSAVLGGWLPPPVAGRYDNLSQYYSIAPRINDKNASGNLDGTLAGTQSLSTTMQALALDRDRIYASGEEVLFSGTGTAPSAPSLRTLNPQITKDIARKTGAFLTASSRAPDLNPFGQPRVTIWPLMLPPRPRTTQEGLLDFCSTVGGRRYAFTRNDPVSRTADAGGRNATLLTYLRSLTSRAIPGFSNATFASKYGVPERDQILVNIFDFIRSSVPLVSGIDTAKNFTPTPNVVYPISVSLEGINYKGFGSMKTVAELDILFYAYDQVADPTATPPKPAGRFMQAVVIPHFYFPHLGYTDSSYFPYRMAGLSGMQMQVGGTNYPLGVDNLMTWLNARPHFQIAGFPGAGFGAAINFISDPGGTTKTLVRPATPDPLTQYPFYSDPVLIPPNSIGNFTLTAGTISLEILAADKITRIQLVNISIPQTTLSFPVPAVNANPALTANSQFSARFGVAVPGNNVTQLYYPGDRVMGFVVDPIGPARGDIRLVAGLENVPTSYFAAVSASGADPNIRTNVRGTRYEEPYAVPSGNLVAGLSAYSSAANPPRNLKAQPFVPPGLNGALMSPGNAPGDWTTSMANYADGAGLDFPDMFGSNEAAHFDLQSAVDSLASGIFYAPNRSMPSPIVFGSLPTGVQRGQPWQTLLFSPVSAAAMAGSTHPGSVDPADHLLLELFRMPVIQPYAMSDRFSTAGRINLNYQMVPFGHITRKTGLYALLKAARVYAVPDADVGTYKVAGRPPVSGKNIGGTPSSGNYRLPVDVDQTLKGFDAKFGNNDVFRTASQICEMPLYPTGQTWDAAGSNIKTFWSGRRLTGDNMRENPYRDLYGRVTVQSNTYTVHYRVQALKKVPGGDAAVWDEARDKVVGDFRGSTLIERFIQNDDPALTTDFASDPGGARLDSLYKFRTLGNRRFAP